jgi:CBS domain-containing protein
VKPASAVAAATQQALRRHAPFDELEPAALEFLASRLALAYHARGARIAGPDDGLAARLHILKQGRVRRSGGGPEVALGAGEMFPIGALLGRRPTVYSYDAEQDCFAWELASEDFQRLLALSPRLHAFCSNHLAALVERSQRELRVEAGAGLLAEAGMLAPLDHLAAPSPEACGPSAPVREVLERMQRLRIGSMIVVDEARRPLGIFTQPDALERVALAQVSLATPIGELMSRDPVTLPGAATLADAALAMARHGIRHVIVTRDGRLSGVVSERDLFALQRTSLSRTSQRIRSAASLEDLVSTAADLRKLAQHLLAQGVGAEQLTGMVSALNDALTQRVLALLAARHELAARWCWLALGSEGRGEQTFATDQDNALIFEGDAEAKRALLAFAAEANAALEACGFPLCKGDVMARNPRWCLDAREWRAQFDGWIRNPQPEALLNASIFFDLRALHGDADLAGTLRASVLDQTRANSAFQRALAANAVQVRPPLGLLRDFQHDEIDLKGQGARLFVDAGRVLALARGDVETSTAARLRGAAEPAAADAFHYVQALRLKRGGNQARVHELNELERRVLKQALQQAAALQERVRLDYAL